MKLRTRYFWGFFSKRYIYIYITLVKNCGCKLRMKIAARNCRLSLSDHLTLSPKVYFIVPACSAVAWIFYCILDFPQVPSNFLSYIKKLLEMVILEKIEENTLALHDRFFFFRFFCSHKNEITG